MNCGIDCLTFRYSFFSAVVQSGLRTSLWVCCVVHAIGWTYCCKTINIPQVAEKVSAKWFAFQVWQETVVCGMVCGIANKRNNHHVEELAYCVVAGLGRTKQSYFTIYSGNSEAQVEYVKDFNEISSKQKHKYLLVVVFPQW